MSGLCGWIGHGAGVAENQAQLAAMALPLVRFDGAPVLRECGRSSAVAVAATATSASLTVDDGLVVALWGSASAADPALAAHAQSAGLGLALAAAYRRDADGVCAKLGGSFALCILDEAKGEALLAIDRMGVHPLSFQLSGDALLFASSADALIRHARASAEVDPQALYNFAYFHMIPSPRSVYRGHERLLPGEMVRYSKGRLTRSTYWRMQFAPQPALSFDALKEEFRDVLKSSVREAAGQEKVGAFLSGGTDSSTVSGILTAVGGKPAETYSIGFEAEGYDETGYARIAQRHFGTNHHEYYVTPDDVVAAIPQIAAVFDQPFGNASAVPAFYCSRLARADGITRMLGGDGGDELFGGNERYSKQHVFALYDKVPSLVRKALLEPAVFHFPGGGQLNLVRKARSYIEQASVPMPARLETYNLLGRFGPTQVFTDAFLAHADVNNPLASLQEAYGHQEAASLLNRMLALDLKMTLADNDLPKVVKACELAGMEVAFPFLTDSMVQFSARLTDKQKLNGTKLRYFFKEALRGFLPDDIINKQKHGFGLPFGVWLTSEPQLKQLAIDSLHDLKKRQIVRSDFIDTLVNQHMQEHAGYHGTMVWVLMMMEQWFKQREVGRD